MRSAGPNARRRRKRQRRRRPTVVERRIERRIASERKRRGSPDMKGTRKGYPVLESGRCSARLLDAGPDRTLLAGSLIKIFTRRDARPGETPSPRDTPSYRLSDVTTYFRHSRGLAHIVSVSPLPEAKGQPGKGQTERGGRGSERKRERKKERKEQGETEGEGEQKKEARAVRRRSRRRSRSSVICTSRL